jgi:DNA-binding transcriptional LysR family regulator
MQMHQIRYFLALCREQNFTRAAERSGVAQPSMTVAIRALEEELGGALFERSRVVSLTALGCAVYPYFARIAENVDDARAVASALTDTSAARPFTGQRCRLRS